MKHILALLTLLLPAAPSHATRQEGDRLVLRAGDEKRVHDFNLGETAQKRLNAWKEEKGYDDVTSTGNWDGFYAGLEVRDGGLFLTGLEVDAHSDLKGFFRAEVPLSEIFGVKGPVPAEWFTGELQEFASENKGPVPAKSETRVHVFRNGRFVEIREGKKEDFK